MIDLDLAELARDRQEHQEAVRHYDRALAALPGSDTARRMVAHRGRGSCLYRLGRGVESTADYVEARR
ncbi:MAG: tetratricopeptide repeat protein, partial [Deltaproteobacteria bacterium]|nr:tetratricopeptide repeat protein [Deltaproteobacteria bacterium]